MTKSKGKVIYLLGLVILSSIAGWLLGFFVFGPLILVFLLN